MKRLLIGAAIAAGFAAPVLAADFPRVPGRAPAVMVPVVYNWTGFYIGANTGGVWGDKDWSVASTTTGVPLPIGPLGGHTLDGWIAGGQVGVNWQIGSIVLGIEGDWSWTNAKGNDVCNTAPQAICTTELNWIASATARIGWAFDRLLLYVKGGAAWSDDKFFANVTDVGNLSSTGNTRVGWTIGTGLEYGLTDHFSAKLEYNYMDLDDKDVILGGGRTTVRMNVAQSLHVVKVGLNFRFGGGGVVMNW